METEITLEEFRLIKSFYPDFHRKESARSNRFIVDWNGIMPVVEKIEMLGYETEIRRDSLEPESGVYVRIGRGGYESNVHFQTGCNQTKLQGTYSAVLEFIKWYCSQPEGNTVNKVESNH